MPYIDDDFKPKPYGDLAYNNSGRNLLVYYPWRGGVKTTGPSPTPVTPTPTPSGGISPSPTPTPSSTFTPTPTTTPTTTPTPTPSPFVASVSIAPTGTTQYENVILSGSTNIGSPTYIWSLTDFYDVSGNTISSYTGQTLTEGYFSSSGSSNVLLTVVGDNPLYPGNPVTATTTNFNVNSWVVSDLPESEVWIDFADSSTMTFRTGTNYIEQIDNKAAKPHISNFSQTTAAYQPEYSATTISAGMSAATFNTQALFSDTNLTGITYHIWGVVKDRGDTTTSQRMITGIRPNTGVASRWGIGVANQADPNPGDYKFENAWNSSVRARTLSPPNYSGVSTTFNTWFDGTKTASGNKQIPSGITINNVNYTWSIYAGGSNVTPPYPINQYPIGIGCWYELGIANEGFSGDIGEIMYFDSEITGTDYDKVSRYLKHKWNTY